MNPYPIPIPKQGHLFFSAAGEIGWVSGKTQ
jgi:hypothetical protein